MLQEEDAAGKAKIRIVENRLRKIRKKFELVVLKTDRRICDT